MAENALSVCVVGLGLMGGSLALALREAALGRTADRCRSRRRDAGSGRGMPVRSMPARRTWRQASRRRMLSCWRHRCARSCACCLRSADTRAPGALDHGPRQHQAADLRGMTGLPEGLEPVGGHPMCGKEVAGFGGRRGDALSGTAVRALPDLAHGASRRWSWPAASPWPSARGRSCSIRRSTTGPSARSATCPMRWRSR